MEALDQMDSGMDLEEHALASQLPLRQDGMPDDYTVYSPWDCTVKSVHQRYPFLRGQALHDKLREVFVDVHNATCAF